MVILGTAGNDILTGTAGDDDISGFSGDDQINGDAGNDTIWGGSGADDLSGGRGDDTLRGESGSDRLTGGPGNDILYGGANSDTFIFNPGDGGDTIKDFQPGVDKVQLAGFVNFQDFSRLDFEQIGGDVLLHLGQQQPGEPEQGVWFNNTSLATLQANPNDFNFPSVIHPLRPIFDTTT